MRPLWVIAILGVVLTAYFHGQTGDDATSQPQQIAETYHIPQPYYIQVGQKYGVAELTHFVHNLEWKVPYSANVFDCTEMSAMLEMRLENEGYHTIICGGYFDGKLHCWLEAEISPELFKVQGHSIGEYVIVESTALEVITKNNPDYRRYSRPDYRYETIYEAMKACPTAYDWWN